MLHPFPLLFGRFTEIIDPLFITFVYSAYTVVIVSISVVVKIHSCLLSIFPFHHTELSSLSTFLAFKASRGENNYVRVGGHI